MRLVVAIEDDLAVRREERSGCGPPGFEAGIVTDDIAVVSRVIVGVDDGVGACGVGDVVDVVCEAG